MSARVGGGPEARVGISAIAFQALIRGLIEITIIIRPPVGIAVVIGIVIVIGIIRIQQHSYALAGKQINANEQVNDLGITLETVADGNILVFEWYLPDDETMDETLCSIMADSFMGTLESVDFLSAFRVAYGVSLDGVRCTFYNADGSEIYRDEIN